MKRAFNTMKSVIILLIYIILVIHPSQGVATSHIGNFSPVQVDHSDTQLECRSIIKCDQGLMWFASLDGIYSYNGYDLKQYLLPYDNKRKMVKNSEGELFSYGEYTKDPLYIYNKITDSFDEIYNLYEMYDVNIHSIVGDTNNRLWIATSGGVVCYDATSKRIKYIQELRDKTIYHIMPIINEQYLIFGKNHIWVATIDLYNESMKIIDEMDIHALGFINDSYYDSDNGNIYLALKNGLMRLNVADDFLCEMLFEGVIVRSIEGLTKKRLLVGTDGEGIYLIESKNGDILSQSTKKSSTSNIASNAIYDIFVDEEFRIWAATYQDGIYVYDPRRENISFNLVDNVEQSIKTIFEDDKNRMWYGTNLGVVMKQHNTYSSIPLHLTSVLKVEVDGNDILVGSYGDGVIKYNMLTSNTTTYNHIGTNYVFSFIKDKSGIIWSGGVLGALSKLDTKSGVCENIAPGVVFDMIDEGEDILVNYDHGLIRIAKENNQISDMLKVILGDDSTDVSNITVSTIAKKGATLYIGTNNFGVICYNESRETTEYLDIKAPIFSIAVDQQNNLWLATTKGLVYVYMPTKEINYIDTPQHTFSKRAVVVTSDGGVEFGTTKGVLRIEPQFDIYQMRADTIMWQDIRVNHNSIEALQDLDVLELEHNQNNISFSFSDVNYSRVKRYDYEWIMEGYDSDWEDRSSIKHVTYTNLLPGKYIFRVRLADTNIEKSVEIRIAKPWWATNFALFVYMVLIVAISYVLTLLYKRAYRRKQSEERIRFFIDASHDIRTPVTLIKAPLASLNKEPNLSSSAQYMLKMINSNVDRLCNLVNTILDFENTYQHPFSQHNEWCSINDFVKEKCDEFWIYAQERHVEIKIDVKEPGITLFIDSAHISTIIENLLSNAIKYSPEGGVVKVSVDYSESSWQLKVSDQGIGIPQKDREKIFSNFYRAKNAINSKITGSGIGLMVVSKLIKEMQGRIDVESKLNEGSLFTVTIPRNEKAPNRSNFKNNIPSNTCKNTLLVVDDNSDIVDFLSFLFSEKYNVLSAQSVAEALDKLNRNSVNLVISDIMMEGEDGFVLCEKIKSNSHTASLPVILLSARSSQEDIMYGLKLGADDYVVKPFVPDLLQQRVENLLESRQLLARSLVAEPLTPIEQKLKSDYLSEMDRLFLTKIDEIIKENISDYRFNIEMICKNMCMSRSVFYNRLKNLTDMTPNDLIKKERMEAAAKLIIENRHPIADISVMVGFSDPKYFSTVFNKYYGTPPSKYRFKNEE